MILHVKDDLQSAFLKHRSGEAARLTSLFSLIMVKLILDIVEYHLVP